MRNQVVNYTELAMQELRVHTLRGDIQSCGMAGMRKDAIRGLLKPRYVHVVRDAISSSTFELTLTEEYRKVVAWCNTVRQ